MQRTCIGQAKWGPSTERGADPGPNQSVIAKNVFPT